MSFAPNEKSGAFKAGDSDAPEVVATNQHAGADGLQALGHPEQEGLQTVEAQPYYSPKPAYSPYSPQSSQAGYQPADQKGYGGDHALEFEDPPKAGNKRKKYIIIGIVVALVIVVAVAVGVGVGITQGESDSGSGNSQPAESAEASSTPASSTAPSGTSSTASSTSAAVTSGATGLAQFDCQPNSVTTSTEDVDYTQTCFTQYQALGADFYNTSAEIENVGGGFIHYNFNDCIDECDDWNLRRSSGNKACRAVTYYANITSPIDMWSGNCFLKTGRGVAYTGDNVDYTHTMSAFWSCLDDGSCTT